MPKQVISTDQAPAAVGAYSQGIIANGFIFTAGQIPLIPGTSSLREGGITAQTRQSMNNVKAVLEAAGSSLDKVVKTTVFLADINDFAAFNAVYAEFFADNPPARSTIQAGGLPVGALVEIEAVATLD
ncbi:MAG: RidA family protein [Chloroflexi bacterium]|nr:RidA family protein [Chloroflexota bacterium]MCY3583926.1 RidA family protein [Chloroflexota bacterium]MCY3716981.1 RidA family protein [Chloroflexota bacterium]MDE2649494.1 RidA family protein [Chloroflexota bacterium]MXV94083.1 RidA family protein [Chloroflexota bacterium]